MGHYRRVSHAAGAAARSRVRLTKASVEALRPPEGGSVYLGDAEVPGFAVRATWRHGARPRLTYVYRYKLRGGGRAAPKRYILIGVHGAPWAPQGGHRTATLTCELAREEARRLRGIRNAGGDPRASRAAALPAPEAPSAPTLREFAALYLSRHSDVHKATSTALADHGRLERYILPRLGHLRLDEVGAEHVAELQASLRSTPVSANRCLALLSHLYTKAGAGGRRGNWRALPASHPNPCAGAERFPERSRERYLTPEELERVGRALEEEEEAHPYEVGALRVLAYTGARPTELLSVQRAELQLAAGLVVVASKTGPRPLAIPAEAARVLKRLPEVRGNQYAFPDVRRVGHHLTRWQVYEVWKRVRVAARCPDVNVYDLRHTFASVALAGGASLEFIGGLLGHTKPETTQRYAHLARAAAPMRLVGARAAREIAAALRGRRR